MLTPLADDIWLCDGPNVTAVAGFHYPTRMAVIRLSGKRLLIWSPVDLSVELAAEVTALGEVAWIVAPNSLHDRWLAVWQEAFPRARLFASPGLRQTRPDLRFDAELSDVPEPDWTGQIGQVQVRGHAITTETVFFHVQSGTVLFTDLIQQMPKGWYKGWRSLVAKLDLMTQPEPAVPRKFRISFRDRDVARSDIRAILDWPARRVVMAHGTVVDTDAPAFLRRAFKWLKID